MEATNIFGSLQALAENTTINFDFNERTSAMVAMTAIMATAATICFCKYISKQ